MKNKIIYIILTITIITAIAGLIIVASLNKTDGEALAETIQTNTDYSLTFSSAQTIQTVQDQPPQTYANKWVTLNGKYTITIDNIGYSLTGNKVLLFVANGNVHYNFSTTESTSNSLQVFFIYNNSYTSRQAQNILIYSNGNTIYTLKNNDFTHIDIKFTSLSTSTTLTTYETQVFSKFWQDLGNIVYNPTQYIEIKAGNYTLNPTILASLTADESIQLTHNLLAPDLTSFNQTGAAKVTIEELTGTRNTLSWSTTGLYPNRLLSGEQEIYTRLSGGAPTLHYYIIKVESEQTVTDNTIAQALTPLPNESILGYYFNDFAQQYNAAYNAGYDEAINNNIISDNTTGLIGALFSGLFGSIFAIEIFPGFPLYIFILIPVVFAVIGIVFWLVRGR